MKTRTVENMTPEQKIGHLITARQPRNPEEMDFLKKMLEKGCVGALHIQSNPDGYRIFEELRPYISYPVLVCADMETGLGDSELRIPAALAIGALDDEELAYSFAKVTAIEAKQKGYNLIWGPVVDIADGDSALMTQRVMGSDPRRVAALAGQMMRAFQECGAVCTAKHYPGGHDCRVDTHMIEGHSDMTEEELVSGDLIPYIIGMNEYGMTGLMTSHQMFPNIDPEYPASLSKKLIDIIRRKGFDGLVVTDSLAMMGIIRKYGEEGTIGGAIAAGNDLIISNYRISFKETYDFMMSAYQKGVITDERLNDAVRHVLAAQNVASRSCPWLQPDEKAVAAVRRLQKESVCAVCKEGISPSIDPDGRYLFVLTTPAVYKGEKADCMEVSNLPFWPETEIESAILAEFPNSEVVKIPEYPRNTDNDPVLYKAMQYDEVIWLAFTEHAPYLGSDALSNRLISIMNVMAQNGKLSSVLLAGNPFALEAIRPVKRKLIGFAGKDTYRALLETLSGKNHPCGKLPFSMHFQS